jgi:arylsulfatase A
MKLFSQLAITLALFAPIAWAATSEKPNIIIIMADDLGYGDLGCYGHPTIKTPNLDRMAAEGTRFTQFYSAAEVCTPSRAALLTGRYPIRSGMCHNQRRVLFNNSRGHLPLEEITLAELVKEQGYATACIGKWHLGVWANHPDGHPAKHGFDHYFGLPHSNDMNGTGKGPKGAGAKLEQDASWWNAPLYRNDELVEQPADQTTLTKRYTDEAVKFIRQHKDKPFFLYFPHTFPHTPLFASPDHQGKSDRGIYGDVVEELDASVGRVLDTLRGEQLAEKTWVFFTSDNGPWLTQGLAGGSAGLLRDGKGSTWEGGMRVPGISWGPGRIGANIVDREVACTMDLFVMGATLAGATVPQDREIDGKSMIRVPVAGSTPEPRTYMYYRGTQLCAARMGRYKVHFITQAAYGGEGPKTHEPPLLYDLDADPGESFNIAAEHADVIAKIKAEVDKHRATLKPAPSQLEAVVAPPGK